MPVEVNIVMDHMAAKMEQDHHKEYTNSAAGPFLQLLESLKKENLHVLVLIFRWRWVLKIRKLLSPPKNDLLFFFLLKACFKNHSEVDDTVLVLA